MPLMTVNPDSGSAFTRNDGSSIASRSRAWPSLAWSPSVSGMTVTPMTGDGTAIVSWKRLVFDGRPGFALKDYLDRRFMKMFQE